MKSENGGGVKSGLSEKSGFKAGGEGMGDCEKRKQPKPQKAGKKG